MAKGKSLLAGLFSSQDEGATVKQPQAKDQAIPITEGKGEEDMSKPTSYFSIAEHTFTTKGRKENKGKTLEAKELALFFEKELFVVPYQPMATVPTKEKYVKESNLKDFVKVLDEGLNEEITSAVLRSKGYKELVQTCKDNKILMLDFCNWVKDELKKLPTKPRGRQAGSGANKSKKYNPLVSLLAGFEANLAPDSLVEKLETMMSNKEMVEDAVEILKAVEAKNGRDLKGYIRLRIRTK